MFSVFDFEEHPNPCGWDGVELPPVDRYGRSLHRGGVFKTPPMIA